MIRIFQKYYVSLHRQTEAHYLPNKKDIFLRFVRCLVVGALCGTLLFDYED